MALPIDQFNANAQDLIDADLRSSFFERTTLLSLATGESFTGEKMGKPGTRGLTGGRGRMLPQAEQEDVAGSTFYEPQIEIAEFGGGGGIGYRQTIGNVTTVDITGAVKVPWSDFGQQAKVMKDDLRAARGAFKVGDLQQRSQRSALRSLQKVASTSLWTGVPASQTAKQMADFVGVIVQLDDGATYSDFFGADKTVDTFLKPAFFSSTATNFDWSLIDSVNKGGTNPNGGAATLGNGVDLVLCNETLFYDTIKPKAIADNHQVINAGSNLPEFGLIGFERDAVRYGKAIITFDPFCPAGTSSAKSYLACLTIGSWNFQTHPENDFSMTSWADIQPTTRERAITADLELKARWVCEAPWQNGLFTAVN